MAISIHIRKRLRPLFSKRAVERELAEELAFHMEMEMQHLMEQGMSEAEARRAAHVAFGGVERFKEEVRQARWIRWAEDLLADVRFALRSIVRYPAFAAAVIVTLALGIGGTTAIFSVVDGFFLRTPSGVSAAADVRKLFIVRDEGSIRTPEGGPGSYIDYEALRDGARAFAGVSAFFERKVDYGLGAGALQLRAAAVSLNHFSVLGVRTALGRFFLTEEDAVAGAHPVVVISHGLWQRQFGGKRDVLDNTMLINGKPLTIIGVTQRGFVGLGAESVDIWVPMAMVGPLGLMGFGSESDWRTMEGMATLNYVGRLAPDMQIEQAVTDGSAALARKAESYEGTDQTPELMLAALTAASGPWGSSDTHKLSLWLALVAGVVLIIACANVANLLLARAIARRRELALRLSLGAGAGRIVRQSLTESLVLALLGGIGGVLIAHWSSGLLKHFPLPPWAGRTDLRLLGFAIGVSVVTGIIFGVLPALRSVRIDPLRGMQDTRVSTNIGGNRTRRGLVTLQVSLSVTLLIGATLFVRSLREVLAYDVGVDVEQLLLVDIDLKKAGFQPHEAEEFWERARARVAQLSAVETSAMVHFAPFIGMAYAGNFKVPGQEQPKFESGPYFNMAGAGYFRAIGARVLEGREFEPGDRTGEPRVIIDRMLARAIAPDRSALGMCVQVGAQTKSGECSRVIGVVETPRRQYLVEGSEPALFQPRDKYPGAITWGGPTLIVRTRGAAAEHADEVRAAIASLRSDLPFVNVRPNSELIRNELLPKRLGASLFSLFGVLALALAAIGLYGVLGYFVTERRPEIGIRRSLGAPVHSVVHLVLRQGMAPVALGLTIGLAAAFAGTRFLASQLHGIEARDPVSFGLAVMFLLLMAMVATLLPARRAALVDPLVALRQD